MMVDGEKRAMDGRWRGHYLRIEAAARCAAPNAPVKASLFSSSLTHDRPDGAETCATSHVFAHSIITYPRNISFWCLPLSLA